MGRRGNIVKFNKKIDFNIGYVVFIVIILYLAISVIIYAASDKVVIYEVNKGSLSLNNVYSGIIARDEQIVNRNIPVISIIIWMTRKKLIRLRLFILLMKQDIYQSFCQSIQKIHYLTGLLKILRIFYRDILHPIQKIHTETCMKSRIK